MPTFAHAVLVNAAARLWLCVLLSSLVLPGCSGGGDASFAPVLNAEQAYWELRLNQHAVQLSLRPPYNTLQLETTMYTATGAVWSPSASSESEVEEILAGAPTVYISRDSTKVGVARDGTITARAVQSGSVYVVATRTVQGVVHADSALVRVADVAVPPILNTFTVRPASGDSAKTALGALGGGSKSFTITMRDTNNVSMSGYPIYMTSSNPLVATVANRYAPSKSITLVRVGEVLIRTQSWVYGVAKADSFTFTVGYPILSPPYLLLIFNINRDGEIGVSGFDLGPGGTLYWINGTGVLANEALRLGIPAKNGVAIDVIFDDPSNVEAATATAQNSGGGDILGIPGDTAISSQARTRWRRFPVPGVYPFRIMPFGTKGTVVVHDR